MSFNKIRFLKISQIKCNKTYPTTLNNAKYLLPDFNRICLFLFNKFEGKTIDDLTSEILEPVEKGFLKFINFRFLENKNYDFTGGNRFFKVDIDDCQRVIGMLEIKFKKIPIFQVILFDPFHQLNIIKSIKYLNKTALLHIYDFFKISKSTLKEVENFKKFIKRKKTLNIKTSKKVIDNLI